MYNINFSINNSIKYFTNQQIINGHFFIIHFLKNIFN